MHAKHILSIAGWALAGLLAISHPALAATRCSVVSTVSVNFGTYDVFNTTSRDSTGSITYTCTGDVPMTPLTIDLGKGNAQTYRPRQMRRGAEALNYNLYLDAAKTVIWGDGTEGTARYSAIIPPNNVNVTVTIYGSIPARQNVRTGTYADTITAVINF